MDYWRENDSWQNIKQNAEAATLYKGSAQNSFRMLIQ